MFFLILIIMSELIRNPNQESVDLWYKMNNTKNAFLNFFASIFFYVKYMVKMNLLTNVGTHLLSTQ